MNTLCAIIVSRGLDEMLRFCLKSFFESADQLHDSVQVIIADNASPRPYTKSSFSDSRVRVLRFDVQTRFAAACNRAVKESGAEKLIFLNNDVFLDRSSIDKMVENSSRVGVGVVGVVCVVDVEGVVGFVGVVGVVAVVCVCRCR